MSGYCISQTIFKTINDAEIDCVEKFVREEVSFLWEENKLKLPYGCLSKDAFGFYAECQSRFKFLPGDRKLIKIAIAHLNLPKTEDDTIATKQCESKPAPNLNVLPSNSAQRTMYFINKLRLNAEKNFETSKNGYRYDDETKMYSSYLRMICGPFGYNILQRNLEGALPSLVSTNRYINASKFYVPEGILRIPELLKYLEERKLPLAVCLSEDATRIVGRLQYNKNTNQIVGFTLPIHNGTGMPIPFSYPAKSAQQIVNHFSFDNSISSFVNVIMAQPLGNYPPLCLSIFGSDCKYSSKDVENRWTYITNELSKVNIKVLIISSDSDPKYNRAMRKMYELKFKSVQLNGSSNEMKNMCCPFFVQDPTHVGTKLRNFLLGFVNKELKFGPNYLIELEHLYYLLNFPKDQHLLTLSVLNPTDRQNFSSVLRMCSAKVTTLLKTKVENSQATIYFLEMIRDVLDSYMDINLSPLARVEKIWYHLFILRIWRHHIQSEKNVLKGNFLTSNCYSCIELNACSLLLCLTYLKDQNLPSWFLPYLYSSQPCESIFRQLRSFTSTYSTVACCSVNEILFRISKIQLQNEIVHSNAQNFVYPKITHKKKHDFVEELPTKYEIFNTIALCKTRAINTAKRFGLKIPNDSLLVSCKIGVKCLNKRTIKSKINTKKIMNPLRKPLLKVSDLKNVNLINYIETHPNPDEMSSFVQLSDKKVVKKTSLCWYLRNDYQKISTDRNKRVMTLTENDYVNKKQKNTTNVKTFKCKYEPIKKISQKSHPKFKRSK